MLGWHIRVERPEIALDGSEDRRLAALGGHRDRLWAALDDPTWSRSTLAVWETGLGGLEFIDPLIEAGTAISVSAGGYPNVYLALAGALSETVPTNPRLGSRQPDLAADLMECGPSEWLLVIAWDLS